MKRSIRISIFAAALAALAIALAFSAHGLLAGQAQAAGSEPVPALIPYVEAHTHFDSDNPAGSVQIALAALKPQNAAMIFLQTPPDTFDRAGTIDAEVILPFTKKYPGKLGVLGGGGSLNPMIMKSVATGDAGPEIQKKFKARAEELLRAGVIGFGEMSAEHFDGATPYEYAPADHPLYLLLADIAAKNGVPIDIHMEAVPMDMPLPAGLKSPPNAPQLHANIAAFERLLAHNPHAKIIWAHAGSDNTGYRTPDLCRRLLLAHPNLYMEIKTDPLLNGITYPLADGRIKPEWLQLFVDFQDRFIIGTDQHYPQPKTPEQRWQTAVNLLNQLPANVRQKIATDNVRHIYPRAYARNRATSSSSAEKN